MAGDPRSTHCDCDCGGYPRHEEEKEERSAEQLKMKAAYSQFKESTPLFLAERLFVKQGCGEIAFSGIRENRDDCFSLAEFFSHFQGSGDIRSGGDAAHNAFQSG